ncbi:MAG: ABC transporter permease [Rhizobiaceae bacterium]|nr:ABC transporter permease [Rhizobiaceae bacterium]
MEKRAITDRKALRKSGEAVLLTLPMMLLIGLGFLVPLIWIGRISFQPVIEGSTLLEGFTFDSYAQFFGDPFYRSAALRSIQLAVTVTILALLVTYPIALFLHRTESRWRSVLVVITIAPLLVSAVVRTYGWMVILGDAGWVNSVLRMLDLPTLRLFNNYTGTVIGLTEIMMPYMALGLIAGFNRIDPTLEEAAASLGATPMRRFLRVTLPLSLPGVGLGCLLSFVLTMSAFVTPSLLGGGRVFVVATEIYNQAIAVLNWPLAAAMSVVTLVFFVVVLVFYNRISRRWEVL